MRRVNVAVRNANTKIFTESTQISRHPKNFIGRPHDDGSDAMGCISCSNASCHSAKFDARSIEVCPVKAIVINPDTGQASIGENCISCGLCALRCPVGAIDFKTETPAEVNTYLRESSYAAVTPEAQIEWLKNLTTTSSHSPTISHTAVAITKNLKDQKASVIYPLVASYFQILGFEAAASNMGDTSSRADVTISTQMGTIPVEVKSFTEVEVINLKSVQQALENKLFSARQDQVTKLSSLSSLVVGFGYPSDRARLIELIEDIDNAFGIRIGLISMPRLIEAAISNTCTNSKFDVTKVTQLKGIF